MKVLSFDYIYQCIYMYYDWLNILIDVCVQNVLRLLITWFARAYDYVVLWVTPMNSLIYDATGD